MNLLVSDQILLNPNRWNTPLIHELFHKNTAKNIIKITLRQNNTDDEYFWTLTASQIHIMKSFYAADQEHRFGNDENGLWTKIWK